MSRSGDVFVHRTAIQAEYAYSDPPHRPPAFSVSGYEASVYRAPSPPGIAGSRAPSWSSATGTCMMTPSASCSRFVNIAPRVQDDGDVVIECFISFHVSCLRSYTNLRW